MADRVLLINPFYPISETPSPPLGLAYLAGALEAAGVTVRILDLVVFPQTPNTIADVLEEFRPDVVGATAVTMSAETAFALIRDVKRIAPDVLTVMGGPHVTFSTEATLAAVPELDVIVRGEGEQTLLDLLNDANRPQRWETIPGLAYRANGSVHQTAWRDPVSIWAACRNRRAMACPLVAIAPWGCRSVSPPAGDVPFNVCFASAAGWWGPACATGRRRVVDEIEGLAALGFRQVNVADDLFTANERHCLAICDEIIRRGIENQMVLLCPGRYGVGSAAHPHARGRLPCRQFRDRVGQSRYPETHSQKNFAGTSGDRGRHVSPGRHGGPCLLYSGTAR
jgi:anaerobic magnesium-protoporphyrin IX monomethyl ester cyclase